MKINIIILSLLTLTVFTSACKKNTAGKPAAEEGIFDLKDYDISKPGPVSLNGQWEFYWKKFHKTDKQIEEKLHYINVPGYWFNQNYDGKPLPYDGYGTYRLRIINNKIHGNLGLYVGDIGSSYDLYINEEKLLSSGKISSDAESSSSWLQPQVIIFNSDSDEIDITIHTSNYNYLYGGILHCIKLGTQKDILRYNYSKISFGYFLFGCILIIGIYHFILFLLRRRDKSPLYFAVYCLLIATFTILTGDRYIFQDTVLSNWEVVVKILACTIYLTIPTFILFIYSIYPKDFSKIILYCTNATSCVFIFLALILPSRIHIKFLNYYKIIIFLGCMYVFYILILSVFRKRKDAVVFLVGFIILSIAVINDMLHHIQKINTGYFIPFGFLGFIVSQTILLSSRLSRTFLEIENLSLELKDLNQNLEKKVKHRTEELHAAMDQLTIMNETIIEKNKKLETAQVNAMMDMDMAVYVQSNFLPKEIPDTKEWDIAYYFKPLSGVSGDFYDFYTSNDKFLGLGLFDVSGHGISSGLVTMIAKSTIFRNFIQKSNQSLEDVLYNANVELQNETKDVDYHLTGVLLKFVESNWINYSNAGHPDILVRSKNIVFPVRNINNKSMSGIFLGAPEEKIDKSKFEEISFKIEKNDYILLYSDCLIENVNEKNEPYGEERLIESFRIAPEGPAKRVMDYVLDKFYKFISNESNQSDDLTVIILKRKV